jgi:hypothetical protein
MIASSLSTVVFNIRIKAPTPHIVVVKQREPRLLLLSSKPNGTTMSPSMSSMEALTVQCRPRPMEDPIPYSVPPACDQRTSALGEQYLVGMSVDISWKSCNPSCTLSSVPITYISWVGARCIFFSLSLFFLHISVFVIEETQVLLIYLCFRLEIFF